MDLKESQELNELAWARWGWLFFISAMTAAALVLLMGGGSASLAFVIAMGAVFAVSRWMRKFVKEMRR